MEVIDILTIIGYTITVFSLGMYCIKGGLHRLLHYIGCRFICGKVIISRGKETHMHRGMARWEAAMPPLIWFPDKQEAI